MTIDTQYLDADGDKIKLARPALLDMAQRINSLMTTSVTSITNLRLVDKTKFTRAILIAHSTLGDGGYGTYYYDAGDTTTADNGGSIIVGSDGGRWKLLHDRRVSVLSFGADRSGSTDSYAACLAAYQYLVSIGGGVLVFPDGIYRLNTTLNIVASGISVEGVLGSGSAGSQIVNGTTNTPAIKIGDGTNQLYSCFARNLSFSQASGVTAVSGNCGLSVAKVGQCAIENIQVTKFPAPLFDGLIFTEMSQSFVSNLHVQEANSDGVKFATCNDIYLTNSRSDANLGRGFDIRDSNGMFFTNATAFSNGSRAWHLRTTGANNNNQHFYTNCIGDTSGEINWLIEQLQESTFVACWGATQINPAVNTFATGFFLNGANVKDLTFSACWAVFNNSHGVHIEQATNVVFRDLVAGIGAHGNGRSGSGSGVFLAPAAANIQFLGGRFEFNAEYGASVNASATLVRFDGGYIASNGVGAFSPGSVGANCVVRGVAGYNPLLGAVVTPAVPATTVVVTNTTGHDVMVHLMGGTVSAVYIGGSFTYNNTNIATYLPAGQTIRLDYTAAPVWKWIGV